MQLTLYLAMNKKDYFNKEKKGQLTDAEWENLAQALINAKFDKERQKALEETLAKKGIHRKPPKENRRNIFRLVAVAASLLLLLSVGWFWFSNSSTTVQQLADQHLSTPFALIEANTRGEQSIEKLRGKALEAYHQQNYTQAIVYLQQITTEQAAKVDDLFQMGLCHIYKNPPAYQNAIVSFEQAQLLDKNAFQDEMNWYMALCHIKLDQKKQAKIFLEEVINSPSSRQQEAAKTLLNQFE